MKACTAAQAVDVLNRALAADQKAMQALVDHRVTCSLDLANDPTVQVGKKMDDHLLRFEVGMLGIINGLFGVDSNNWGFIAAMYDSNGSIAEFVVLNRAVATP